MKYKSVTSFFIGSLLLLFGTRNTFSQNFWEQTGGRPSESRVLSLAINSDNHIFVGTLGSGNIRSINDGDNWTAINNGLTNLEVWSIAINSVGDIFIGTRQSKIFRSIDNGENWMEVYFDQTFTAFIDALAINSDDHIFAGYLGVIRSTDNGNNWTEVGFSMSKPLVNDFAINPNGHIFAGTSEERGVFRSTDNGDNWTEINVGLPSTSVFALAINSNGHIFAGTIDGDVFRSTDNGENWTETGSISAFPVEVLVINSDGHIFAGTGGTGVYRSIDNGDNWIQIVDGLTDFDWIVDSFAIDSTGIIFAGTSQGGVFRSVETTTSVSEIAGEIPTSFTLEQNYPNPFNPTTTIKFSLPQWGQVTLKVYDVAGRKVTTLLDGELSAGEHGVTFEGKDLSSGVYFYRLQSGQFVQTQKLLLVK